jgi:hypothetical protein
VPSSGERLGGCCEQGLNDVRCKLKGSNSSIHRMTALKIYSEACANSAQSLSFCTTDS